MATSRKTKPAPQKDNVPRTYLVKVYVTEREQCQIRLAAAASNMTMTEFCRLAAKDKAKAAIKGIADLQDD